LTFINPVLALRFAFGKMRVLMGHVKLHIPGPVEVSEKTFKAFCSPMIGHRGQGFKDLYAKIQPQLQQLLSTKQLVVTLKGPSPARISWRCSPRTMGLLSNSTILITGHLWGRKSRYASSWWKSCHKRDGAEPDNWSYR